MVGPYVVKQWVNDNNYVVKMERKKERIFHVNSMKQYTEREGEAFLISVVSEEEDDSAELLTFPLKRTEEPDNASLGPNLSKQQTRKLQAFLQKPYTVLSDKPGSTSLVSCQIPTSSMQPVRVPQYPLPHSKEVIVEKEVQEML